MKKYQAKIYRVKIMLKLLMMIYHDHAKKSSTIFDRFNALMLYLVKVALPPPPMGGYALEKL